MTRILVIGASGGVGRETLQKLIKAQCTAVAGVRRAGQLADYQAQGIDALLIDPAREKVSQLAEKLKGIDAVVYAAGGGLLTDLDGKVKVAKAMEIAGIKRFILISAIGIHHFHDDTRWDWMDELEEYSVAMYYADGWILRSSLDYTIIRPAHLLDEPETGQVELGDYLQQGEITRADVAGLVLACLANTDTIGKAFDANNGKIPITEAVAQMAKAGK